MTAPNNKPVSDEDLARFSDYRDKEPTWGVMHIVLEDQNVTDADVQHCIKSAERDNDAEGLYLSKLLLGMSKSQRLNLKRRLYR